MSPEELSAYARMLALLSLEICKHRDDPCDILGSIYRRLNLNNEWNGQFFTPDHLCRLMAEVTNQADSQEAAQNCYVTICDPACGSGAMFLASVWAMIRKKVDFQTSCLCVGRDIDIRCVWMAYIQLCLYEIPAVVVHGDSITMEEWSVWCTPLCPPAAYGRWTKTGTTIRDGAGMKEPQYSSEHFTLADLYPRYHTGQAYLKFVSGKNKVYGYHSGMMTPVGDIEKGTWEHLVQEVMKREKEEKLYSHLLEWVQNHYPWLHDTQEKKEYTLELYASRIFDNPEWRDYLAFNQKYRPEILQNKEDAHVCESTGNQLQTDAATD